MAFRDLPLFQPFVAWLGVLVVAAWLVWRTFLQGAVAMGDAEVELSPVTPAQVATAARMKDDVTTLAKGPRNLKAPEALRAAEAHLAETLRAMGYSATAEPVESPLGESHNLWVQLPGTTPMVVLGAHYDTAEGAPGANDNASGVAALLELARRFRKTPPKVAVRLVFFTNEEPPHFQTPHMGSRVHAEQLAAEEVPVRFMLSLESLGYYDDTPGSQDYPSLISHLYPDTGNYVAFVGRTQEKDLVGDMTRRFQAAVAFPAQGAALPETLPGIDWSDHASFWRWGVPAVMVTDTAVFRDPAYHTGDDVPERLDYARLARVVDGLEGLVRGIADESDSG